MRLHTLSAVLLIAFLSIGVSAQTRKLYPVDEAAKDPSFKLFRDKLIAAAKKRDKNYVLSILDPKIQLSFGGHGGLKDFNSMFKLDRANDPFWNELIKILKMGGSFQKVEGQTEFNAPYVSSRWPEDPALDIFEYRAITGTNVRLRASPSLKAPIVETLSYDIVKVHQSQTPSQGTRKDGFLWLKVSSPSGKEGYVATEYLRSPIDYRAYFRKVDGKWRMTAFIAGD